MIKNFITHASIFIFRGLLAIIPLLLCFFIIRLLYVLIDKKIIMFVNKYLEVKEIPGLGIMLLLVVLYLIGLVVSNIVGKQAFRLLESLTQRIPLMKTVYGLGKQLSNSLSDDQEKKAFKKAILIKMHNDGPLIPGFVMGSLMSHATGENYLFVLAPAASHPWTGFVMVVKDSQIIDPGWSVEECLKIVLSVGIVTPKEMQA